MLWLAGCVHAAADEGGGGGGVRTPIELKDPIETPIETRLEAVLQEPSELVRSIRTHVLSPGGTLLGSVPLASPYVAHLQV